MTCPNVPFLKPSVIIPSIHDVNVINTQLNQLSVGMSTQGLRSKLEKAKRQRLNTTVRNIEREVTLLTKTVAQTQSNITMLRQQIENLTQVSNGDFARLATVTYRCLLKMHNILIPILPYIVMPPHNHEDLAQMVYELLRTVYQLPTPQISEV